MVDPALYGVSTAAQTLRRPQCWRCSRTLAEYLTPPFSVRCPRCKAQNRKGAVVGFASTS